MSTICLRPGCGRPVPRGGRGRPAIYCSPACRPSRARTSGLLVEVDAPGVEADERPTGRVWRVQLRRGRAVVVLADGVGRLTAMTFASEIRALLTPDSREGGAIE